jgi:hypothetical protein
MTRKRTVRVGGKAPARKTSGIDPRWGEIAVFFTGGPVPGEVPARDLNGGDLDRIAYVRRFRAADGETPGPLAEGELEALVDELVAGGSFSRERPPEPTDEPEGPDKPSADDDNDETTTEPEPPAEAPEG